MTDMEKKTSGKLEHTQGHLKEEAGKLGGDKSTEISGKIDQAKGQVKETWGERVEPNR